jgi:UDP-N-acetylmuramyl pentapeptide phosphotransferase/UDP-N-acetylglucosamine-1-phosphate transferase
MFMGDVGSTFLGLTCAFLALLSQNYYPVYYAQHAWVHKAFIFTLTPLSFLWFDVAFTLLRRAMRGKNLAQAHREHLIHILNDCGYSHPLVSGLYFFSAFLMGVLTHLCHQGVLSFLQFLWIYALLQSAFVFWVFYTKQRRIPS